jgi:hypothetical protein
MPVPSYLSEGITNKIQTDEKVMLSDNYRD